MRAVLTSILLMASFSCVAQEPLSFKGLPMGSSLSDIKAKFPSTNCYGDTCFIRLSNLESRKDLTIGDTVANSMMLTLHEGQLHQIYIVLSPSAFTVISAALQDRYGKPTTDELAIVKTRAGVEHENRTMEWRLPAGQVIYTRLSSNVTESSLMYVTYEHRERAKQKIIEGRKKAAGDL